MTDSTRKYYIEGALLAVIVLIIGYKAPDLVVMNVYLLMIGALLRGLLGVQTQPELPPASSLYAALIAGKSDLTQQASPTAQTAPHLSVQPTSVGLPPLT